MDNYKTCDKKYNETVVAHICGKHFVKLSFIIWKNTFLIFKWETSLASFHFEKKVVRFHFTSIKFYKTWDVNFEWLTLMGTSFTHLIKSQIIFCWVMVMHGSWIYEHVMWYQDHITEISKGEWFFIWKPVVIQPSICSNHV